MSIRTKIALIVSFFLLVLILSSMVVSAQVGSNVFLSNIEIKKPNGEILSLSPSFLPSLPATTPYTLAVDYDVETITITPSVADISSLSISVGVNSVESGEDCSVSLAHGATTTVTVTVTGPGGLFQDYTLNVTRVSLSDLQVTANGDDPSSLLSFQPTTTTYTLVVDCNVGNITVTPTVLTDSLTFTVRVNGLTPPPPIVLDPGATTRVTVTVEMIIGDQVIASRTYIITVTIQEDTTPPGWDQTMPSDVTVECDNVPEVPPIVTASDNCDSDVAVIYNENEVPTEGDCPYNYTLTRTWTATDDCENDIQHVQTITVQDTTPPELTLPDNLPIGYCESIEPAATGWATVTDNCDSNPLVTYSDSESDTYPSVITRTWTATDVSGNSVNYDQTITVEDQTFLDDIILNDGTLQPAFKKWARRQFYQVYVGFEVESINVKPITANPSLIIKINDEEVPSGNFYSLTPLEVGRNNFNIRVTTPDETSSKTYTIQVLRDAGTDTSQMLTNFTINPSPFSPAWSQGVKDIANFNGELTREIPISLRILDENNEIVRFVSTSEVFKCLYNFYRWKGLGEPNLGSPVLSSGLYNVQATTPLRMNWRFGRLGGDSRGILLEPHALAIDSTGNVFIGSNGSIQVFDSLGNFLYFIGPDIPCLDFRVSVCNAMAFNPQGKLMVLQSPHRLLQLEPDGSKGKVVINFKEEGIQIDWLDDLAVGSDGTIYVSCREEGKVLVFSSEGILHHKIRVISESAQVPPSFLNGLAVGQDGKIYVTTIELEKGRLSGQVKIFSSDGTLVKKVQNMYGRGPLPILEPRSIGVLSDGSIVVADGAFLMASQALGSPVLARLSPAGELLNSWGEKGSHPGGFSSITRLRVVDNNIYVSDHSGNHQVIVMDENGRILKTFKTPPEKFVEPVEIVRIDGERFVIADKKLERCTVMRSDGSVESSWQTWDLFQNPGEGLNGVVAGPDGSLYIYRWNEIVVVSPEGNLVKSINLDIGKESFMPTGCLIDEQGHIVLCGQYPGALWVFDRDGHLLQKFKEKDEEIRGSSSGIKPSLWAGGCGFFGSVYPSSENGIFVQRLVRNSDGSLDIHVCELDLATGQIRKDIPLALEFQGECDFRAPFIVLNEYFVKGNVKVKVGPSSIRTVVAYDREGNFQWSLGEVPGIGFSLMDLIGEGDDLIMLEKSGSDIRVESWNVNSEILLGICQVEVDNDRPVVNVNQPKNLVTVDKGGFFSLFGGIEEKNLSYYSISYRRTGATHSTWISVLSPQGKRKFILQPQDPQEDIILARFSIPRNYRNKAIEIKVIAVDTAGNRSDSEKFIAVDFDDDGDGLSNANDTEPNINNSVKMVLEPLYPENDSELSKVMQGGVIYRYYSLKRDQSDEPIARAKLAYHNSFTNKWVNITSDDNGEVVLEITTSDRNNVRTYNECICEIGNIIIGGITYELLENPSFPVEILPLTYSTNWVAGNGCSAKGGIGIAAGVFVTAQQAGGMVISRTLKDPLRTNQQDSLGINNNFSTEVGVGVGACLGGASLGPVEVSGPEASASVSVGTFNEFTSLFNTPGNSVPAEKLKEGFFLLVGVENALSMGSSQLLIWVIDLLSAAISDPTEIKEILQGVNLSIDADASLANFGLDTGKEFILSGLTLGSISESYNISAAIIDYPAGREIGAKISLTLQAEINLVSVIGYNIIGNEDLAHRISLEVILDESFSFKRAVLSVSSPPNGDGEIQAIDFIIESALISEIIGEIEQFSQILSPLDFDQYTGLVLDQYMVASILHTIIGNCSEIKIPYKKVVLMDEPPITLNIGLGVNVLGNQIDLGISPEFGMYNSFTLEEGVFVPIDRENNIAKFIKYSSYSDSLFSADVDSLPSMVVELLSVIGDALAVSWNVVSAVISDLGDTIIDIGADIGGVAVGGAEVIFKAGTSWFSFYPDVEIQKPCILPYDIKDMGKEIVALPTDYLIMGGVGEFYYLPPIKNGLSKPFLIALKSDKEEKRVTIVSIAPLDDPFIVGGFYSLQPIDESLSKPAILNLTYTDKAIKGRDRKIFFIYRFNKEINAWEVIPSKHDRSEQKLTAEITQLGEYCIGYDDTPPVFSLLDYSPGEIILTALPQLRIKCQDTGSGIDFHSLVAKIDDEVVDLDFNPKLGVAQLNYDFPLDAGERQVTISGQDTSGNLNTQKFILEIRLPPSPITLEEAIVGDHVIELRFSLSQEGTFPLKQLILRRAEPYKGKIFHLLAILEPETIYFEDKSIEPKTNYAYQIFAEDTRGNRSIYSNIVYAEY